MNEKMSFLPFHAINEFMLPDFQKEILRHVLSNLASLDEGSQKEINVLSRKLMKIQGFKNIVRAPLSFKINAGIQVFEKSPQFVAALLYAWQHLYTDLAAQVWNLLSERGWKLLPLEADRRKLPGFMIQWPEQDSFEILTTAFHQLYPENGNSENNITLMIVWLSMRLPYEMVSPEQLLDPMINMQDE